MLIVSLLLACIVNVSSYAESLAYNLRVAGALFRQVYVAEGLAPPRSLQVIQDAYKTIYARAIDPNYWTGLLKSGEWKKVAVYAVEAYGIFHIGQMVSEEWHVLYASPGSAASLSPVTTVMGILTLDFTSAQIGRRHLVGYKIDKKPRPEGDHH